MDPFFEIRIYSVNPGKMDEWINLMENTIIPFQVSKGAVIHGSFVEQSMDSFSLENGERVMNSDQGTNKYIWIRRFASKEDKEKVYKEVYESEVWINEIGPKVAKLIDRNSMIIHNVTSTNLSIMK